jgi:putative transposase
MRTTRTYDHRIRDAIVASGDPDLFPDLRIPRSTVRTWLKEGPQDVVRLSDDFVQLRVRIARLEKRVAILYEVIRLLLAWKRAAGQRLDHQRFGGTDKKKLLTAITKARRILPLKAALAILGLRPGRYHSWSNRERLCEIDDRSSCARRRPGRLSYNEVRKMGDLVTSTAHRHMSIRALALYAQRTKQVFAHPVTWCRLIKERGWRRPRLRVYPAKPKVGVRAARPNQYWHIDASIIRLVDGTRVYLHAVIDNYSRRILGWRVEERLNPLNTFHVLSDAASNLSGKQPADVVMDAGVENVNSTVDPLFSSGQLRRVLAQVDVTFSNSLIEAWWRSLKHQWLYLHHLDTVATVRRLVGFYVREHNEVMPHWAFNRAVTPDEVYFEKTDGVVETLRASRVAARAERLRANQEAACPSCPSSQPREGPQESAA